MDALGIYVFKSRLVYVMDNGIGFSWTSLLSPRPYWLDKVAQGK